MKLLAIVLALGLASAACADSFDVNSTAVSGSSSSVDSQNTNLSGSTSHTGNVTNTINYPATTTSYLMSQSELKNVPGLGSLALGGGHPCAYSPVTGQFAILGGGAGIGGMKVDDACMLMVMGYNDPRARAAAEYMIASRSAEACAAMQAFGMVTCASNAPKQSKDAVNAAVATAVADEVVKPSKVAGVECVVDKTGKVVKIYAPSGYDPKAARKACQ